jgi:hypothetical protein
MAFDLFLITNTVVVGLKHNCTTHPALVDLDVASAVSVKFAEFFSSAETIICSSGCRALRFPFQSLKCKHTRRCQLLALPSLAQPP